ncbi:MAG: hypothetical protein IPM21_00425 [Acidobacteria bacterium]|nr:hypothetical protein [Acidobacteriota bacterium]
MSGFSILLFCGSLAAGVAMMLQFETGYLFWPAPIIATAVMAFLFYSKQSALPTVLYIDKAKIVLDGGVHGEITFQYHGVATRS